MKDIRERFEKEFGARSDYFNHRLGLFMEMEDWIEREFRKELEPLRQRLDQAEKEQDEFALGFLRFAIQDKQIQRLIDGEDISDEYLLSEYKQTLKGKEPVIGTGIPEGGNDYQ